MTRRVLISAAGTGTAFTLFTRLRANWGEEVRLFSADINPSRLVTSSVLSDQHFQVPRATEPSFITEIHRLITLEKIDTYVPLLNAEIGQAPSLSAMLPDCDVWASPLHARLAGSKRATSAWLTELGISTPPVLSQSQIGETGTYFAKPDDAVGSYGARLVKGEEAQKLESEAFIVQPVCSGPEITVDSFFDIETGCLRAIARERIEVKSGVSTKARIFEDRVLTNIALCIGQNLDQRGTICFQVMKLDGEYVVTDLNFRPGAGTALTVAIGIDLISAAFACRWGENYKDFIVSSIPPEGIFVTRQYTEFVM